jgi:hypothetical protein
MAVRGPRLHSVNRQHLLGLTNYGVDDAVCQRVLGTHPEVEVDRRVIFAGVIAGLINGIIDMVAEGIAGAGFWSPVVFIAAAVERELQVVPVPVPFLPLVCWVCPQEC